MKIKFLYVLIVMIASCAPVFVDVSEQLGNAKPLTVPQKHPELPKLSGSIAVAFLFKAPDKTIPENSSFIEAFSEVFNRNVEHAYPLGII